MARDYKNASRPSSGKRSGSGGLPGAVWLLLGGAVGLAAGLVIGLGVVGTRMYQEVRQELEQTLADNLARQQGQRPAARPSPSAAEDRPRFEFYKILPELEVVVPEEEQVAAPPRPQAAEPTAPSPAAARARYLLQAGSFQNLKDADRLKAQLALLGVEANIQSVEIRDGQTWHRVRVGPFPDLKAVDEVRKQLQSNGVDAVMMKLSG